MTWKDKMEIGLKDDAPFRRDNLPENETDGPEIPPAGEGRSPVVAGAVVRSLKRPSPASPVRRARGAMAPKRAPGQKAR